MTRADASRFRGAMLLEVIVSIGLLLFGMVMVGLQINAGLDAARHCDIGTRAVMLADIKLAELDAGVIQPEEYEEELMGDFGIRRAGKVAQVPYPGYTWRMEVEPAEIEDLYMVTLEIGYNEEQVQEQIDDPEYEIEFEDEGRVTVRTVYRLYPKPADVDLERDFGFGDEEMEMFLASLEAMSAADTGELADPSGLAGGTDMEGMADLLGDLMAFAETGSFDPRMLSQLPPEQFMMVAEMLEAMFGRSGGTGLEERLRNFLPKQAGQGGQGGREGGARDGAKAGKGGAAADGPEAGGGTGKRPGRRSDGQGSGEEGGRRRGSRRESR